MKQHAWAVIGYGGMGSWHVENVTKSIPSIRIKGAFDIRPEACAKARERGLTAYQSLDELLRDDELELVTIATPNDVHRELSVACLEAGKNVVCEKPVTLNAEELTEVLDAAKRAGKLFSVHQNRRWDKDYLIIKRLLDEGTIGTPYFIESRVQGSRGAMHGWRGHRQNGGGMVLDWGAHLIDQMMSMIPSPLVSVDAHLFNLYSDEVDDNIKLFLRFENGLSALLEMSTNCLVNHPRWHMSCTDGTAVIQNWECEGQIVKLKQNAEQLQWAEDIVYTAAGPTRTMAPRPDYTKQFLALPKIEADWSEYYRNIAAVLDGEAELIVKPEQTLRVMKAIDLVFESQRVGHGLACKI